MVAGLNLIEHEKKEKINEYPNHCKIRKAQYRNLQSL